MDERVRRAGEVVNQEARFLDEQDWDAWLALYEDDAQFWVPTWRDEKQLTTDPSRELSFMFLQGRTLLAERVRRLTSGPSTTSVPVPRTSHLVAGSIVTLADAGDSAHVKSSWSCHVYQHKDAVLVTYAGRYEHELVWTSNAYHIRRKKVILINDRLVSEIDFFYI
jgi:3-phenylpropionate/cinnamic acid dioxygenase small subunit